MTTKRAPAVEDIEAAERRVRDFARETPILQAGELSRRVGARIVLKAENLQRTGSFKVRGAFNMVSQRSEDERRKGIVTASAGNHGQAVARVARELSTSAEVFMPSEAPLAKVAAVRHYGGEVRHVDGSFEDAAQAAHEAAAREGRTFVPAFDDPDVIAGQGTLGLELARQAPGTTLIVVPLGGGGLAAGVAIAAKARLASVRIVGVQAEARGGSTICDGIAVKRPGALTAPLIERHLDDVVTVNDDEAAEAMVLLLERSKLVVEGAGAVGVAALMHRKIDPPPGGGTCVLLTGGNVDPSLLVQCIRLGETAAGRRFVLTTVAPDRPGMLARLLATIADQNANIITVDHLREGIRMHVRETALQLVLQTTGPDHNAAIVQAVEAAGFTVRPER